MNIDWNAIAASNLANVGKTTSGDTTHYEGVSFSDFVIDSTVTQHFTSFHLQQGANKCFPNRYNGSIGFNAETYDGTGSASSNLRLFIEENVTRGVYMSSMSPSVENANGVAFSVIYGSGSNDWHYFGLTEWNGSEPFSQSQSSSGNVCTQSYVFVTPDTNVFSYVPASLNNDYYVIPESKFTEKLAQCHLPIYNDWDKLMEDLANNSFNNAVNFNVQPVIDGLRVDLWRNFSKRKNSTKRPANGEPVGVILKENCDITLSPIFIINRQSLQHPNNISDYNYLKFNNRYYYIENKISIANDLFEFRCIVDSLASGKNDITNSAPYVLRAASHNESMITDELNPATHDVETAHTPIFDLIDDFLNYDNTTNSIGFNYILQVANKQHGASFYYFNENTQHQLGHTTLEDFYESVFNQTITNQINNQFYGLKDCLLSLKRVPYIYPPATNANNLINVYVGSADSNHLGYLMNKDDLFRKTTAWIPVIYPSDVHSLPKSYLDFAPYSEATIHLPFVGVVPLPLDVIGDNRDIQVKMVVDYSTGDIVYDLLASGGGGNNIPIARYTGNCSTDVPIVGQSYNAVGMLANGLSLSAGVASMMAGNPMGAFQAGSAIAGMTQSSARQTQINGKYSSAIGAFIDNKCYVDVVTHVPVNWDVFYNKDICGVPVCRNMALNVTGYVQTRNANIETSLTETEKQQIDSALDSGIYIE